MPQPRPKLDQGETTRKALLARYLVIRFGQRPPRPPAARAGNGTGNEPGRQARQRGLRSPLFKLRAYVYKLRGRNFYITKPGPRDFFWSCCGAFIGIFVLVRLSHFFFSDVEHLLIGSFGASSLIIFGAPHSDYAQPRSVVGGQILSALAGAAAFALLGAYPNLAAAGSVMLAFAVMQLSKTLHPPGGATALIAGSGQPAAQEMGWLYPFFPVGAGILLLFVLGVIINNISRHRQYPRKWF
ncbi:MAG: HPP family protein [Deltaproteobacteria bacterium]|jgi:CBS-domain-containing membrane protein|nr:HPP family protein [Deltaproteobacteria bacterium]